MATERIRTMFSAIEDGLNPDVFASFLTEGARFQLGNMPAVTGRAAIRAEIAQFYGALSAMRHAITGLWDLGDVAIIEANVHYTRQDGSEVVLPCTTIWRFAGDQIADDRIYMDAAPLFAA